MTPDLLVLGPLVRYVDATTATVWAETGRSATVIVHAAGTSWSARTFAAHGHHYALVEIGGLEPGGRWEYRVDVDGTTVWPEPGSRYPGSMIATLQPGRPLRMAFGSCRTSVPHDREATRIHGVDALRAFALRLAEGAAGQVDWPDLVLFLGDQVYADETTEEMRRFIAARRDIDQPPGEELKDFEEYAHLYRLAWSDPANRWLLSTLASAMIFDDHDIRDDWNTSQAWKERMEATSWWHERIVAGLGSYWVYQHLGNLSPAQRAQDELWQAVAAGPAADADEVDLTERLDAFASRVDQQPTAYRWSFTRDIDDVRLVVVDSRAARVLDPQRRSMLDPKELAWLDQQMQGGYRHLLVGTSLPFLLSPGLHRVEAWDEALVAGAWGRRAARVGERLRQVLDLEHWAAFHHGFAEVAEMVLAVAYGERGPAPETVTFLSGDVHHSYISEVTAVHGPRRGKRARIVQAVCSPMRNPLPRSMRFATAFLSYGLAGPVGALATRSAHVPQPPLRWRRLRGPWFDNNVGLLADRAPGGLEISWFTGVVVDGDDEHPRLEKVADVTIGPSTRPRGLGRLTNRVASPVGRVVSPVLSRVSRSVARRRRGPAGRSRRPH